MKATYVGDPNFQSQTEAANPDTLKYHGMVFDLNKEVEIKDDSKWVKRFGPAMRGNGHFVVDGMRAGKPVDKDGKTDVMKTKESDPDKDETAALEEKMMAEEAMVGGRPVSDEDLDKPGNDKKPSK